MGLLVYSCTGRKIHPKCPQSGLRRPGNIDFFVLTDDILFSTVILQSYSFSLQPLRLILLTGKCFALLWTFSPGPLPSRQIKQSTTWPILISNDWHEGKNNQRKKKAENILPWWVIRFLEGNAQAIHTLSCSNPREWISIPVGSYQDRLAVDRDGIMSMVHL